MSNYFPKLIYLGVNVKFESDLSNYAMHFELKNEKGVVHKFSLKRLI